MNFNLNTFFGILFACNVAFSQSNLVDWKVTTTSSNDGNRMITFEGKIAEGWIMYAPKLKVDGPIPLKISYTSKINNLGEIIPEKLHTKFDDIWGGDIDYFVKEAVLKQNIKSKADKITGLITYQTCTIDNGECKQGKYTFEINNP